MSSQTFISRSSTSLPQDPSKGFLDLIADAFASLTREVRIRHDLRQLEGADEAMLHDIGISRGEIDCAVRCGRPR